MLNSKNISIMLLSLILVSQAQAAQPKAAPSDGGARISLILVDEKQDQKNYSWGVTRPSPLKVIQGWFAFDNGGIRDHGGGGRDMAEAGPMRLSLQITKEDGFLVKRDNVATNRIEWPPGASLRTHYHSEPRELTDRLQPLWKGDLIKDKKGKQ